MLNAAFIANRLSGSGGKLHRLDLPAQWRFEAGAIDWQQCLSADLIVMFGGDGTVQHTVTELLNMVTMEGMDPQAIPPVAIVPFGTTNMSALNINHSRTRAGALRGLTTLLRSNMPADGLPTDRHPLLALTSGEVTRYGYCFGIGAITEVVTAWRAKRRDATAANRLRSLLALIRGLGRADGATQVELAGQHLEVYALLLTTLERLIYGSRPFWGSASQPDAAIRTTWIKAGTTGVLRKAPALLRGAPRMAADPGYGSRGLDTADLQFRGPFILDGEVYEIAHGVVRIATSNVLRWLPL